MHFDVVIITGGTGCHLLVPLFPTPILRFTISSTYMVSIHGLPECYEQSEWPCMFFLVRLNFAYCALHSSSVLDICSRLLWIYSLAYSTNIYFQFKITKNSVGNLSLSFSKILSFSRNPSGFLSSGNSEMLGEFYTCTQNLLL